ncbi:MAG: hypothetical protein H0V81_09460 [Solirubrobacterales bacterium]|nr:hypothetical protein [Solirubrobacterales bacterium]
MHRADVIEEARALAAAGATLAEVVALTGVPRSTVRDWLSGAARGPRAQDARRCGRCGDLHDAAVTETAAYAYLLGIYLGDGCISPGPRGVHRLRVNLDSRYPEIIEECAESLRFLAPRNRVGRQLRSGGFETSRPGSATELSVYAKWWPCLIPQHGPGRKHRRPIVLVEWQAPVLGPHAGAFLRGLLHSDGCRFINTGTNWRHPRYSFSNRSDDIRGLFTSACDVLGLRWTTAPYTVYVSRKDDVARLDAIVGPKR